LIGLIIGAVFYGVDEAADRLYYDVRNFYSQNKEDYIKQYRTELKQAILQTKHNLME